MMSKLIKKRVLYAFLTLASFWACCYFFGDVYDFGTGKWFAMPLLLTYILPFIIPLWFLVRTVTEEY